MTDPAAVNPVNIVTIGAFATIVVSGLFSFLYWMAKRHEAHINKITKDFSNLQEKTNTVMTKVTESADSLKNSVDNLAARSKTESDYATLMVKVLEAAGPKKDSPPAQT